MDNYKGTDNENIIIKVVNLTKTYGNINVLDNVSVNFERGQIHGLVGRNGSGKTMLMKCICGFVMPTKGSIIVEGKIIGKDIDIPKNIGAIIENPGFLANYSGYNNLKFLASINKKIDKEQIRQTLKTVGLDPDSKKHVSKYSMGMRQRLGLAQALMEDPDILFLDEPMNGLDKRGVEEMRALFSRLREEGKTIIMANHSAEDIDILCDTVYEMDLGVIHKVNSIID